MAKDTRPPRFAFYLLDESGDYYTASLSLTGIWTVSTTSTPTRLQHLPKGWNKTKLSWQRDTQYWGVFRSQTNTYEFTKDGAAILYELLRTYGIEAKCTLRVDMLPEVESTPGAGDFWTYTTVYQSEIKFSDAEYNYVDQTLRCQTLDSRLFALLEAYGDTEFNIPFWTKDGEDWDDFGCEFVKHHGMKLPYSHKFLTSATEAQPLTIVVGPATNMYTLPSMTDSLGTPYIGNPIIDDFLPLSKQNYLLNGVSVYNNYSTNSYLVKSLLPVAATNMKGILRASIKEVVYNNPPSGSTVFFKVDIVGIDNTDTPMSAYPLAIPELTFTHDSGVPAGTLITLTYATPIVIEVSVLFDIQPDWVYILRAMAGYDPAFVTPNTWGVTFTNFNLEITSVPGADLRYPSTTNIGMKMYRVWELLIPCLNSTSTTPVGFPVIPPGTPYSGVSDFLHTGTTVTPLSEGYDNNPFNTFWTSGNALRLIDGQPYFTTSVQEFFKTCFAIWGLGLGIEGDDVVMEPLEYFLDSDTEILDLGYSVANLQIAPLLEYAANKIKVGYTTKWMDFAEYIGNNTSYYGIDAFNFEQHYRLPIVSNIKTLDWVSGAIADGYKVELARSQGNDSTASASSSNNANYLIEIESEPTESVVAYTPDGEEWPTLAYKPKVYPTIGSTLGTPPAGRGLLYPDTMINYGLSPARCALRKGGLISSITDALSGNLMFEKQFWQLNNGNTSIEVSGIATNLNAGLVTEVADVPLEDFASRLFRPWLIKFTTGQPLNMYALMNTNPRGYITFKWRMPDLSVITFKGYVWDVEQNLGDSSATTFTLLMHKDQVF